MRSFRKFILRSHRWHFFRCLYDSIYRGGRSFITILGRLDPSIIGMFLRISSDPIIPGLSDYDLTVTPRDAPISERLRFLDRFWQLYGALKRILPMLGETDILPSQDLIDYMLFGPGPTVARKRLSIIFERFPHGWKKTFQEAFAKQDGHVSQEDILREAILRHIRFVVPRSLEYILNPDSIQGIWLNHLAFKVLHTIQNDSLSSKEAHSTLYQEFCALSLACRQPDINGQVKDVVATAAGPSPEVLSLLWPHLQLLMRSPAYPSPSIVLWRASGSRDRSSLAVVIDDDLEKEPFLALIRDLARAWRDSGETWQKFFDNKPFQAYFPVPPYPVHVSRSQWRSWMYLVPLEAAAVSAGGQLLAGDPSVLAEARPHLDVLPRDISTRYAAMLSLRNNWRTLTSSNRPKFYHLACEHVRTWRSALEGKPICTMPELDQAELVDLHQGYEMLQQELMELRHQLIDHRLEGARHALSSDRS